MINRKSKSPYCNPLVCIGQKDDTLRFCVDYRKININTVAEIRTLPRMQADLDSLRGSRWFAILKERHISLGNMDEYSKPYSASVTLLSDIRVEGDPSWHFSGPGSFSEFHE